MGGWKTLRAVPLCPPKHLQPPSTTPQPDPDPTTPQDLPSTGVRGLSLRDARKRVRSLKLQLFCTLVGLEASGMSSVLGERCRGGPRCCLPRLPCRCELLRRMRSLMPILLLRGRAGWAASGVTGCRGGGRGWGRGEERIPAAGTHGAHCGGAEDGGGCAELTECPRHTTGTSSRARQARSRWYHVPVQEQLWGYSFKHHFFSPREEKGGDRQTGRAQTDRYGGG